MYITKVSGERAKFNPLKIRRTCLRAGADRSLARKIERLVSAQVREGMSTRKILLLIIGLLGKLSPVISSRYALKEAMLGLGPAGFVFERFVVLLLKAYNYQAHCPPILMGRCVKHEIDVVATIDSFDHKKKEKYLIECKYHNAPGIKTDLQDTLCLWARFDDFRGKGFDYPWLISNTKFSKSAIQYANCRNIKLLGWQYPLEKSLNFLVEEKKIYPITILKHLDKVTAEKLFSQNVILASQLLSQKIEKLSFKTGISKNKLNKLMEEARLILEN